ncbi:Protein yippee-like protein [Ooceraea biroi]|nr:Protein yippee-like protein [Ooceraea biroi]
MESNSDPDSSGNAITKRVVGVPEPALSEPAQQLIGVRSGGKTRISWRRRRIYPRALRRRIERSVSRSLGYAIMVKTFQAYLPSCHRTYSCIHCRAHLANHDELISKSFQGSQGRAYLFNSVVNVGCGPAEERVLLTGLHAVADIYCECCKTTLGWKYEHAFESSQKYKEGKFIIELAHMIKENGWE